MRSVAQIQVLAKVCCECSLYGCTTVTISLKDFGPGGTTMDSEVIEATRAATNAFERAQVRYYLCGSMASSLRGLARATIDVDFVAEIRSEQVAELARELGQEFDVDEE